MWHTFNFNTKETRGRQIHEFKSSQDYRESSRIARATQRNSVLKNFVLRERDRDRAREEDPPPQKKTHNSTL